MEWRRDCLCRAVSQRPAKNSAAFPTAHSNTLRFVRTFSWRSFQLTLLAIDALTRSMLNLIFAWRITADTGAHGSTSQLRCTVDRNLSRTPAGYAESYNSKVAGTLVSSFTAILIMVLS